MIDYICEITARIENSNGAAVEVVAACPVMPDKTISIYRNGVAQRIAFIDGIADKVKIRLKSWIPWATIKISVRKLDRNSCITCGDTPQEIVSDLLQTYLAVVGGVYNG